MKRYEIDSARTRRVNRREFLRAAAGGALAASGLYGCGGGGGNGGGGGGGNVLPWAMRQATFDAVDQKIANLTGADDTSRRQELLAFLQSRPEFEAAGEETDATIWARFTDGRLYLLIANRDFPMEGEVRAAQHPIRRSPPAELPERIKFRLLAGLEPQIPTAVPQLKGYLIGRGYQPAANMGTGTIYDLKRVIGDGVFYLGGHGGTGKNSAGVSVFGVTSATEISNSHDALLRDDWDKDRIVYARPLRPGLRGPLKKFYCVTSEWVKEYWRFGPNSLVYIDACSSANDPLAAPFSQECINQDAGVYVGWTMPSYGQRMNEAALYVFDRLLGYNDFERESPPQRPFDYQAVKIDMADENPRLDKVHVVVTQDFQYDAELVFKPGSQPPPGPSGLLNPSIQYMDVNERTGYLHLIGKFGEEPIVDGIGRVTINGIQRPYTEWKPEEIVVDLPVDGPASAGDVIVYNRDRKSNPRRLTDWRGRFTVSFKAGAFEWGGPIDLHFRADIHSFRLQPGEDPVYRIAPFWAAPDSKGTFKAQGEQGNTKWHGEAPLRPSYGTGGVSEDSIFLCKGEFDPENRKLRMVLAIACLKGGLKVTGGDPPVTFDLPAAAGWDDGPLSAQDATPAIYMETSSDFVIDGDVRFYPEPDGTSVVWNFITPTHAPDPQAERSPRR